MTRSTESRTLFLLYEFVMHWRIPMESCRKPLVQAYDVGLKTGDTENGLWAIYCYLEFLFNLGTHLRLLVEDCQTYCSQMAQLKQVKKVLFTKISWQFYTNLSDASSNRHILTGEIMNQDDLLRHIHEMHDEHARLSFARYRMYADTIYSSR